MSDAVWNPEVSTAAAKSVIDDCVAVVIPYFTSNALANPFEGLSDRVKIDSGGNIVCSLPDMALLKNLSVGGKLFPPTDCIEKINKILTEEFDQLQM